MRPNIAVQIIKSCWGLTESAHIVSRYSPYCQRNALVRHDIRLLTGVVLSGGDHAPALTGAWPAPGAYSSPSEIH
jgi:hypothetical protein